MAKGLWAGAGFVLGGALGLAAGLSLRPGPEERPAAAPRPEPAQAPAAAAPAPSPAPAAPRPRQVVIPPPAQAPAGESPEQAIGRLQKDNQQLRAELGRIRTELQSNQAEQRAEQGEPIPPPPNLDHRFSQEALLDATQRALKQAGFDKAQVTSIDCTEYPCIVYGDGMGHKEDFDRLTKADAMSGYQDDAKSNMGWGVSADGGQAYRFGMAIYPRTGDAGGRDALLKRLRYRAQQMMNQ